MFEMNNPLDREIFSEALECLRKRRHGLIAIALRPKLIDKVRHRYSRAPRCDNDLQEFKQPVRRLSSLEKSHPIDSYFTLSEHIDFERPGFTPK